MAQAKVQCLDAFIVLVDWVRGCDFTVAPKYPEKLAEYRGQKHLIYPSLWCGTQNNTNIISVL
jgi:hypothetical protein